MSRDPLPPEGRDDDPLRTLWHTPAPDDPLPAEDTMDLSLNALSHAHRDHTRALRRRNLTEVFAAGLVVALFGAAGLRAATAGDLLAATGSGLVVLGALVIVGVLTTRGEPEPADPALSTTAFLQAHRDELLRQARLLDAVPWWYVGPLVPGLAVLDVAAWPGAGGSGQILWALSIALQLVVGIGVLWLNRRAAEGLRAQARALPDPDGPGAEEGLTPRG